MPINIPVYQFLGFKLHQSHLERKNDAALEYFEVKTENHKYDEEKKIFSIFLRISFKYATEIPSYCLFGAGFQINDSDWLQKMGEEAAEAIFVSVLFPYVRAKVFILTDDSRGGLQLPIIDLRNVLLSKGIIFTPNNGK
jgi:hypothetical protein